MGFYTFAENIVFNTKKQPLSEYFLFKVRLSCKVLPHGISSKPRNGASTIFAPLLCSNEKETK